MLKKLFKRTRDVLRQNLKPKENISYETWQIVLDNEAEAKVFQKTRIFKMFQNELKSAEEIVLTNRVHEVREVKVISEFLQKIFTTTKEEQTDELVGQIKFIREFLAEIQSWIDRKVELERMEANGEITIDRGTRK